MRILSLFTKHRSALSAVGALLEGLHAVEKAKQSGSPFPADGLPLYCRLFYFRMVFLPCGRAAAQMTLLFIHAQHLLHLVVQSVILLFQTVCNILVERHPKDCR